MATIINASTTSGLVMTSDLSGSLQFQNNGVNLPMGGVAPAFSAYNSASQTVTTSTETKATLNTEDFDTNSNFASSRFTPTVAGYYQVNGQIRLQSTLTIVNGWVSIYKNGSIYVRGQELPSGVTSNELQVLVNCLIYLNGSTDYIELYGYVQSSGTCEFNYSGTPFTSRMQACLVRGA